MNCREAAFLALFNSLKGQGFIAEYLDEWFLKDQPQEQDLHLAQQIAYGSSQMALALDYLALQVSEKKKINLKLKERALLRTAIYQLYFLDRVPVYAVVNETIRIAKKYFHHYFISYLNALLRKFSEVLPKLPQNLDATSLSIRYSYPLSFVADLCTIYGLETAIKILEVGNKPAPITARIRKEGFFQENQRILLKDPFKVVEISNHELMQISKSSDHYIQNVTPVYLIGNLCVQRTELPKRILDMCAAPGGKILAAHDFFLHAELYANDVSQEKINKIKENLEKYGVKASLSCAEGQSLEFGEKFDVIILDVPCSNSGVLNKRPEARWRLNEESYSQLEILQQSLIKQALKLLNSGGEIWYMTCSILPRENEVLMSKVAQELSLKINSQWLVLPNQEGWDGGFACCLSEQKLV